MASKPRYGRVHCRGTVTDPRADAHQRNKNKAVGLRLKAHTRAGHRTTLVNGQLVHTPIDRD